MMKGRPLTVALVANIDPNRPGAGGVRAHTLQLRSALEARKVPVVLLGRGPALTHGFVSVTAAPRAGEVRFTFALFGAPKLRDAVLHAQYPLYCVPWVLRGQQRLLCVLHGDNVRAIASKRGPLVARLYCQVERFALRRCACIVAVSDEIASVYTARFPELRDRMRVIPLEPDPNVFFPRPRASAASIAGTGQPPTVLFVGRLRKDKRPDFILRMFAIVRKSRPNAFLGVVGDGNERASLEALVRALGLGDSVRFYGNATREEVAQLMVSSDVLVLASVYESGPLVVAEARSCGARVVATDVGRVRDFQSRYGGIEIVAPEEQTFAEAVLRAISLGPLLPPESSLIDDSSQAFLRLYEDLLRVRG